MSTMLTFIATSLAIGLPWAYSMRRSPFSWSTVISSLLLVHSLSGLHTLLLRSPPNVFKTLQIALNTPTDAIRSLLLRHSDAPELNPEFEELLRRLASFDVRSLYPRFGHNVLATCTYCHSFEDFALYALPRPVMSYLREIAFLGLITTRRRKVAVTALLAMALLEFYVLATVEIKIPLRGSNEPVIWWHDILLDIRNAVFFILPLLVHFVPPFRIPFISRLADPPVVDPTPLLMQTHQTMAHLLPALHFLKYAHAATMRVPDLRARASAWWEDEARVGAWIREDGADAKEGEEGSGMSVRGVAKGLGFSFDEAGEGIEEGKLRTSAKNMTRVLIIDGLKPSDHWHRP
ncbi:hypothetical protein D9615_005049 [Tricholomella constricta]|uniref:Uncharacterized protein n=1 Tax=Tricholomella constricta TaxID=117010 RepID=A0A8H5HI04_9AGAR|nr:hypothetical protein D9615_005049 [Tricholomella constricta]